MILIGTQNQGKVRELENLLSDTEIQKLPADAPDVVEDRGTLTGNARKKAEIYNDIYDAPTIADDSGLEVNALAMRPGVKTARFAGEDATTTENIEKLLSEMEGQPYRSAQFRTVIAFTDGDSTKIFQGRCNGFITREPRGDGGFGYDPVFTPTGGQTFAKTFAEMSEAEKNKFSHRRKALERFKEFIR